MKQLRKTAFFGLISILLITCITLMIYNMAMVDESLEITVRKLARKIPSETAAWKYAEKLAWPEGPVCPHCESTSKTSKIARKHYYRCNKCGKDFRVTTNTIYSGSRVDLRKWLLVLLMLLEKDGRISIAEIAVTVRVSNKTAGRMRMKLREACGIKQGPLSQTRSHG